jgi:hypothetical protein
MTVAPNRALPSRGARGAAGDALAAGAAGAVFSAVPSTVWTIASGGSLLEGAVAAGSILLPKESRTVPLVAASVPVHLALSLGWAAVLAAALPRRGTVPAAVAGAVGIAVLDLGLIARRFPRVRVLPQGRQWADHVAYGLAVGVVVQRRRATREAAAEAAGPGCDRARATTARARPDVSRRPPGRRLP